MGYVHRVNIYRGIPTYIFFFQVACTDVATWTNNNVNIILWLIVGLPSRSRFWYYRVGSEYHNFERFYGLWFAPKRKADEVNIWKKNFFPQDEKFYF